MKKRKPMSQMTKNKISKTKIKNYSVKEYNLQCSYCGKSFIANRNIKKTKSFCSTNCSDKFRYHNRPNIKGRVLAERISRYTKIGQCELCGIAYLDIKTIRDLGSNVLNGNSVFHKDHIIPISKGGDNSQDNIRHLCWFCNMTRKDIDKKYDEAIRLASVAFWNEIKKVFT